MVVKGGSTPSVKNEGTGAANPVGVRKNKRGGGLYKQKGGGKAVSAVSTGITADQPKTMVPTKLEGTGLLSLYSNQRISGEEAGERQVKKLG